MNAHEKGCNEEERKNANKIEFQRSLKTIPCPSEQSRRQQYQADRRPKHKGLHEHITQDVLPSKARIGPAPQVITNRHEIMCVKPGRVRKHENAGKKRNDVKRWPQ